MTAEELLMSAEVFNYSNVINIDGETREINIPIGEEFFGVEGDEDVERKYFSAPMIVGDNVDLSKHNIYINYVLADKDGNPKSEDIEKYLCDDVVVDGELIKFSWKLSKRVLLEDGFIAFSVMAKKSENGVLKTVWYTTPGIGRVSKTIKEGSDLSQVYPDVLDNLINRVIELEKNCGKDVNLTGYATEAYVKDYAQPKGNYALKDDLKNLTTVQIITWESGD